jgi:hypothetical protein
MQIFDNEDVGIAFNGLRFWHSGETYTLGELTNGDTDLDEYNGFVCPAEGRYALNNGDEKGFAFNAFQVLQVTPVKGLCS